MISGSCGISGSHSCRRRLPGWCMTNPLARSGSSMPSPVGFALLRASSVRVDLRRSPVAFGDESACKRLVYTSTEPVRACVTPAVTVRRFRPERLEPAVASGRVARSSNSWVRSSKLAIACTRAVALAPRADGRAGCWSRLPSRPSSPSLPSQRTAVSPHHPKRLPARVRDLARAEGHGS
jgi:hypothetical protein